MAEQMSLEDFERLPAAARVSLRRFGQRTRLVQTDYTLAAATALEVATNSPDRLSLLMVNDGQSNPATVTASAGGTVTQGDVIGASGGSYQSDALTDGEATGRGAFAISTLGTTIHVEEVIGYGPIVELPPGVTPL